MSILIILALAGTGLIAGLLGSLVGLGGGVIITPALVLIFGLDFKIAVATSLVAVVATSTAAGSVFVGQGLSNMKLAMVLEIATTLGAILGGLMALMIPSSILAGLFSVMMVVTALLMTRSRDNQVSIKNQAAEKLSADSLRSQETSSQRLWPPISGVYFDHYLKKQIHYQAQRISFGSAISFVAGVLSGLLGVGGGIIKVPAMNLGMGLPIKVAAATSNFMIGVTAVSSLFVYFSGHYLQPLIAAPVAIGVIVGALGGSSLSGRVSSGVLRNTLCVLILIVAVQMFLKSIGVGYGNS